MASRPTHIVTVMAALLAAFASTAKGQAAPQFWGTFSGPVTAEWLPDGRLMLLLADFYYLDPHNQRWDAPKGSIVDGASIPRPLWTVVGSPFTGLYRNASVVHDVACKLKPRPWREVHKMFYFAMRGGGVPERQAKIMYFGVFHGGPRWTLPTDPVTGGGPSPPLTPESVKRAATWIDQTNPSLEEIERTQP